MIPLCVSFDQKEVVKAVGSRWDKEERAWFCSKEVLAANYKTLKPFVPRFFRHDLVGPVIRPWMVPQPLWGKNLRAVLEQADWDRVRKKAYQNSGYRCHVCGGKGKDWPVEADEAWYYDNNAAVSVLKGLVALCPDCHAIRHWGRTSKMGDLDAAFARLMKLNQWTKEATQLVVDEAFREWHDRSEKDWDVDYSWIMRSHGLSLKPTAAFDADNANKQLVQDAKAQHLDKSEPEKFWTKAPLIANPRSARSIRKRSYWWPWS